MLCQISFVNSNIAGSYFACKDIYNNIDSAAYQMFRLAIKIGHLSPAFRRSMELEAGKCSLLWHLVHPNRHTKKDVESKLYRWTLIVESILFIQSIVSTISKYIIISKYVEKTTTNFLFKNRSNCSFRSPRSHETQTKKKFSIAYIKFGSEGVKSPKISVHFQHASKPLKGQTLASTTPSSRDQYSLPSLFHINS